MDHRSRLLVACAAIVGLFLVVQLGALAFVEPAAEQDLQEFEDGGDPSLSIAFVVGILLATGAMLAALRYGGASLLRGLILLASVYIAFFALEVLVPAVIEPTVGGVSVNVLAVGGALGLGVALYLYPEWYVVDTAGVVMGIGAAGLFGINFGILAALVLLVVLAVYDAISVYGTEHMLTLASGVMEMRVPVVLVVPLSLSYSFLDADPPDPVESEANGEDHPAAETAADDGASAAGGGAAETGSTAGAGPDGAGADTADGELTAAQLEALDTAEIAAMGDRLEALDPAVLETVDEGTRQAVQSATADRDALFIGLGDAIIPTVLVASAAFFIDAGPRVSLLVVETSLPAVTAMVGTLLGLLVLLWLVTRGRAHAGLPLLNGGAIAGYLLGALASGLTLAEAVGLSGVF